MSNHFASVPNDFWDMKEEFLHFVWETRSFDGRAWATMDGAPVEVVHPGELNRNQGPDFLDAHVRIEGIDYFGHVEIHLDGRDWYRHQHHTDPFYNPVVLHVVWKHSPDVVQREDGTCIPEVSLKGRVGASIMQRMKGWTGSRKQLPCGALLRLLPRGEQRAWLGECAQVRVNEKMLGFEISLKDPSVDWGQLLWEALAGSIGGTVNGSAFRCMAERLPFSLLSRYLSFPESREALMFGVLGCLGGEPRDTYHEQLQQEWQFLQSMHQLSDAPEPLRFHRMRPANFPTLRISQLGHLLSRFPYLVNVLHPDHFGDFLRAQVQATSYWEDHAVFGSIIKKRRRRLGASFLRVLFLNCVVPLGMAYARAHGDDSLLVKIREYPRLLAPEDNRITRKFIQAGIQLEEAQQSQGMIHLFRNYCLEKRCLECKWGKSLLRASENPVLVT